MATVEPTSSQDKLATAPLIDLDNWNEAKPQQPSEPKQPSDSVLQFLSIFKCKAPIFPNSAGRIIQLNDRDTLGEALKLMTQHQILAIPVVDHKTGKPLYILTMADLVSYFVSHFSDQDFKTDFWTTLTNFFYLPEYCEEMGKKPLSEILPKAVLEPMPLVNEDHTVLEAVKLMLDQNAHRALVQDNSGNMISIITQSRIIQLIASLVDEVPSCKRSIRELGLGFKKVLAVREDQIVYKAFRSMVGRKVTCLAVVNEEDKLVGNLSVTDFKLAGYRSQYWNYLGYPVADYLKELSSKSAVHLRSSPFYSWGRNPKTDSPVQLVISVRPEDSLGMVIKYITFFRVHRVYIVDDEHRPLGVITLTDLLKELLHYNQA